MTARPTLRPDANKGVIDPPVDTVQEFAVQANSYNAQFGRTSGAVINMVTKSGTNDIHGVAYDFERHSVLDANNFFNNRSGIPNPSFQRHQFGANAGGPILKSKWFAFGDYEGLRQGYPITSIDTVPTALQRKGDFSQTVHQQPARSSRSTIRHRWLLCPTAPASAPRSPATSSPRAGSNPVALAALNLYPQPNTAGTPITNQNNYIYSANSVTNGNKYDLRTDANFTDNTRMFVRVSRQQDVRSVPGNMPLPIGGGRNTTDTYTQAVTDLTHVFSPRTVADINFSFTRALAAQFGASQGFNLATLNLPASYVSRSIRSSPSSTSATLPAHRNGSDTVAQYQPRNVFSTLASVSYQWRKHSFKFGADWRLLHFNEGANNQPSGILQLRPHFYAGSESRAGQRARRLRLRLVPSRRRDQRLCHPDPAYLHAGLLLRASSHRMTGKSLTA